MFGLIMAIPIVLASGLIGIKMLISVMLEIKESNKGKNLYLYGVINMLCLALCLSFFMCYLNGEHLNSKRTKEKIPIEKLTNNKIYFNNKEIDLSDSRIIIESPNNKLQNVVIEEKEDYMLQWIWKIKMIDVKYHVYLSEK